MANPQLENGFTKIPMNIVNGLIKCSPGFSEGRIILAIIRKTYGWHKTCDHISISQLAEMTNLSRRTVIYALHNLEEKCMITIHRSRINKSRNEINLIAIQSDTDKWQVQEINGSKKQCRSYRAMIAKQKEKYRLEHGARNEGCARNHHRVVQELVKVVQETENTSSYLAPTKDTLTINNNTINNNTKETKSAVSLSFISPNQKSSSNIETLPEEKFVLPDWIPLEVWDAYLDVRHKRKASDKPAALNAIVKKLIMFRDEIGDDPVEILMKSANSGWSDVYSPDE